MAAGEFEQLRIPFSAERVDEEAHRYLAGAVGIVKENVRPELEYAEVSGSDPRGGLYGGIELLDLLRFALRAVAEQDGDSARAIDRLRGTASEQGAAAPEDTLSLPGMLCGAAANIIERARNPFSTLDQYRDMKVSRGGPYSDRMRPKWMALNEERRHRGEAPIPWRGPDIHYRNGGVVTVEDIHGSAGIETVTTDDSQTVYRFRTSQPAA